MLFYRSHLYGVPWLAGIKEYSINWLAIRSRQLVGLAILSLNTLQHPQTFDSGYKYLKVTIFHIMGLKYI